MVLLDELETCDDEKKSRRDYFAAEQIKRRRCRMTVKKEEMHMGRGRVAIM